MIHPIPVNETYEYILPSDKENPTIWILGFLDSITKTKILVGMFDIKYDSKDIGNSRLTPKNPLETNLELCRFGLKGFKNFKHNGKEIEFKTEVRNIFGKDYPIVSDETLGAIPDKVLRDLAGKILEELSISKEQEKNS